MPPLFRRPALSRRRLTGGLVGVAAFALVVIAPAAPAAAEEGEGTIVFGARVCDEVVADPIQSCDYGDVGALSFVSEDETTYLTMDEAVADGDVLIWNNAPLGNYFIDTDYLAIPEGYQLWDMVAPYGNAGGSEYGWYIGLTSDQPDNVLYAIYTPIEVDSDGDGASDDVEIVWGSDPYDAASFPSEQSGADDSVDSDGDGASDEDEIAFGSDPFDATSFPEVQGGPEPVDSDGDGASDEDEIAWGSDPNDANSVPGQADPDPSQVDTDGDGATDDVEVAYGSDPYDTNDHPAPLGGSSPAVPTPDGYSVTALPNTGSGVADATATTGSTALAALLGVGALAFAGAAVTAQRRKA